MPIYLCLLDQKIIILLWCLYSVFGKVFGLIPFVPWCLILVTICDSCKSCYGIRPVQYKCGTLWVFVFTSFLRQFLLFILWMSLQNITRVSISTFYGVLNCYLWSAVKKSWAQHLSMFLCVLFQNRKTILTSVPGPARQNPRTFWHTYLLIYLPRESKKDILAHNVGKCWQIFNFFFFTKQCSDAFEVWWDL